MLLIEVKNNSKRYEFNNYKVVKKAKRGKITHLISVYDVSSNVINDFLSDTDDKSLPFNMVKWVGSRDFNIPLEKTHAVVESSNKDVISEKYGDEVLNISIYPCEDESCDHE